MVVSVSDSGRGIDATAGAGVGSRSMRERAEAHGGTLHIGPGESGGTTVRAELPL